MRSLFTISIIALLVAGAALAQETSPTPPPVPDQPAAAANVADDAPVTTITDLPTEATSSSASALRAGMLAELRAVRDQESAEVADLVAELQDAVTGEERLDLQNRIGQIKADAIQQSLEIQLEYAVLGGHEELAQRLEADIEQYEARRTATRTTIRTDTVRERPVRGGESR